MGILSSCNSSLCKISKIQIHLFDSSSGVGNVAFPGLVTCHWSWFIYILTTWWFFSFWISEFEVMLVYIHHFTSINCFWRFGSKVWLHLCFNIFLRFRRETNIWFFCANLVTRRNTLTTKFGLGIWLPIISWILDFKMCFHVLSCFSWTYGVLLPFLRKCDFRDRRGSHIVVSKWKISFSLRFNLFLSHFFLVSLFFLKTNFRFSFPLLWITSHFQTTNFIAIGKFGMIDALIVLVCEFGSSDGWSDGLHAIADGIILSH